MHVIVLNSTTDIDTGQNAAVSPLFVGCVKMKSKCRVSLNDEYNSIRQLGHKFPPPKGKTAKIERLKYEHNNTKGCAYNCFI